VKKWGNRFSRTGREDEKTTGRTTARRRRGCCAGRLEAFRLYWEMEYVITEVFPLTEYKNVAAHTADDRLVDAKFAPYSSRSRIITRLR